MKKFRSLLKLLLIGIMLFAVFYVLDSTLNVTRKTVEDIRVLTPQQLLVEGGFGYPGYKWNANYLSVDSTWSYDLEHNAVESVQSGYLCYRSRRTRELEGITGHTCFYFEAGENYMNDTKLKQISFQFPIGDDPEGWYAARSAELEKVCGFAPVPLVKTYANDQWEESGLLWAMENSWLSLTLRNVPGEKTLAILSVGVNGDF